jgi:hypothetical protein
LQRFVHDQSLYTIIEFKLGGNSLRAGFEAIKRFKKYPGHAEKTLTSP